MKNHRAIQRPTSRSEYDEMERYERRLDELAYHRAQSVADSFWRGVDPRRRVEKADGGMVQEDPRAMANLSERAIHQEYPERRINSFGFGTSNLFDTLD